MLHTPPLAMSCATLARRLSWRTALRQSPSLPAARDVTGGLGGWGGQAYKSSSLPAARQAPERGLPSRNTVPRCGACAPSLVVVVRGGGEGQMLARFTHSQGGRCRE